MRYSFITKSKHTLKQKHYVDMFDCFHKNKFECHYNLGITIFDYEAGQVYTNMKRVKIGFAKDGDEDICIPTWAISKFITEETHPHYFV